MGHTATSVLDFCFSFVLLLHVWDQRWSWKRHHLGCVLIDRSPDIDRLDWLTVVVVVVVVVVIGEDQVGRDRHEMERPAV